MVVAIAVTLHKSAGPDAAIERPGAARGNAVNKEAIRSSSVLSVTDWRSGLIDH